MILQLGGQTALKLAEQFVAYGLPIIGTPFEQMDLAEDRGKFSEVLEGAGDPVPALRHGAVGGGGRRGGRGHRLSDPRCGRATCSAGRACASRSTRTRWPSTSPTSSSSSRRTRSSSTASWRTPSRSTWTVSSDGDEVHIAGMMQHIEPAGVHSGDSTAVLPPVLALGVGPSRRSATTCVGHRDAARRRRADERAARGPERDGEDRSTSSRPTRAPAGPSRSWRRRRACPWPTSAPKLMLGEKIEELPRARRPGVDAHGLRGQGAGLLVGQVPRGDKELGPGDEVHRRGHRLRGRHHGRAHLEAVRDAKPVPLAVASEAQAQASVR